MDGRPIIRMFVRRRFFIGSRTRTIVSMSIAAALGRGGEHRAAQLLRQHGFVQHRCFFPRSPRARVRLGFRR